jgi:predicted amidophosphoribosyltransferase
MINIDESFAKELWNRRPNEYNKARYTKRKSEGLCVHCGAKIENADGVLCCDCKDKSVASARYNRKKKKLIEESGNEQRD